MKTIAFLACVTATAAIVGTADAKPADFRPFVGKYTKQGRFSFVTSGVNLLGKGSVKFSASKNGRTGKVKGVGSTVYQGITYNMTNTFGFGSRKALNISRLAPLLLDQPYAGTYSAGREMIQGTATIPNVVFSLQVRLKKTKRRATMIVTYLVSGNGLSLEYGYRGTQRIKPVKN